MNKGLFRKGIVLGIIALFVGASVIPSLGGTVLEKNSNHPISNGNTLYVGGSGEGNYTSIQEAINDSSDGDIIFVYDDSSPYYENVEVNKSINLIGENRETTVIDGAGWVGAVIYISADWVNMSGFIIRNSSGGISFGQSRFCNITGNTITSNNGSGICLCQGWVYTPCFNTISDNIITLNKENGIYLYNTFFNTITGNIISNNGNGIYAGGDLNGPCSENIISDNTIASNYDNGIKLTSGAYNNIIYNNIFINNSHNAYDGSWNDWDNGYPSGGNFWDDYNGTDNDGDGIGDTPYPIPGINSVDRYPLGNFHPDKPDIDGPSSGKPDVDYNYTFIATDPEGDDICYLIGWGDKEKIYIYGPYPSGEEITLSYNWSEKETFTISAKTRDTFYAESNWSEFEVEIPRTKTKEYSLFQWFLERIPFLKMLLNNVRWF